MQSRVPLFTLCAVMSAPAASPGSDANFGLACALTGAVTSGVGSRLTARLLPGRELGPPPALRRAVVVDERAEPDFCARQRAHRPIRAAGLPPVGARPQYQTHHGARAARGPPGLPLGLPTPLGLSSDHSHIAVV